MNREANNLWKWLLGVDVGGTKIATLLVDDQWQVREQVTLPTNLTSPHHTLDSIIDAICETINRAHVNLMDVGAIGLGIPGQVEPATGVVNQAVNLRWDTVPAGMLLHEALGVPCFLENDVRTAAWGLHHFDQTSSTSNMAYLSVGTGIAAGLVINGQLYRGRHGMAGEIGHCSLELDGPRCACGVRGCLEALSAGPAIARMAREALATGAETSLRDLSGPVGAGHVYQAAAAGDAVALGITAKAGQALGRAVYNLALTYDVERVIIGGGVAAAGDAFFRPITDELDRLRAESHLARSVLTPQFVQLLAPGYNAGGWGAVALAETGFHHLLSLPADAQQRMIRTQTDSLFKEGLLTRNG